jgi:hypothetical protein
MKEVVATIWELQDRMKAKMDANQEKMDVWRRETTACQEATETCPERKEPAPVEMTSVAAHPEGSNEEAAVKTVGTLQDRYGDRRLALGRRRRSEKQTQDDG